MSPLNADIYEDVLKQKIKRYGFTDLATLNPEIDINLATIGANLFADESLSFNSKISCKSCHLDEHSSTDGLPNAIGVGGAGKGKQRLESGGLVVPRNVLPLWGRGIEQFTTLFWDGKVELRAGEIVSQFLNHAPSDDPLVVAAHLPLVEIREMVLDNAEVDASYKLETVDAGNQLLEKIISTEKNNPSILALAAHFRIPVKDVKPIHVGQALATHIRNKFRLRKTGLNAFINGENSVSQSAINGGLLFYGKGRCVACHDGPMFSDLDFHVVAFPQAGFGKNGFGVDYGRYNVTDKPSDLYKFRTPPLIEVMNTAPYGHSGSLMRIEDAISAHFDPLKFLKPQDMKSLDRVNLLHKLQNINSDIMIPFLDEREVDELVEFLKLLSFVEND